MEDLPLNRTATLVPAFAVKDLPLGRKYMMMMINLVFVDIKTALDGDLHIQVSKLKPILLSNRMSEKLLLT